MENWYWGKLQLCVPCLIDCQGGIILQTQCLETVPFSQLVNTKETDSEHDRGSFGTACASLVWTHSITGSDH